MSFPIADIHSIFIRKDGERALALSPPSLLSLSTAPHTSSNSGFFLNHSLENNLPNGDFLKMAMISSPRLEKSGISLSAFAFISTLCMGSVQRERERESKKQGKNSACEKTHARWLTKPEKNRGRKREREANQ